MYVFARPGRRVPTGPRPARRVRHPLALGQTARNTDRIVRYTRLLALLGLVGSVAIGAAVAVRVSRGAPARRAAATIPASSTSRPLERQLQRLLAPHQPLARLPLPRILTVPSQGGTCFVGPGGCSETPCVVPVAAGTPSTAPARAGTPTTAPARVGTPSAVTLQLPAPAVLTAVPRSAITMSARPVPPVASGCPQRQVMPQTLRVVGP
jgi:hypothetical protein